VDGEDRLFPEAGGEAEGVGFNAAPGQLEACGDGGARVDPQPVHRFDVAGEEPQRQRFVEEYVVGERYEDSSVRVDHPFLYRVLQRLALPHFLERGVEAPPRGRAELAARFLRLLDHFLVLGEYDELFEAVERHVPDAPP